MYQNQWQLEPLRWVKGRHSLSFGGNVADSAQCRQQQYNSDIIASPVSVTSLEGAFAPHFIDAFVRLETALTIRRPLGRMSTTI